MITLALRIELFPDPFVLEDRSDLFLLCSVLHSECIHLLYHFPLFIFYYELLKPILINFMSLRLMPFLANFCLCLLALEEKSDIFVTI